MNDNQKYKIRKNLVHLTKNLKVDALFMGKLIQTDIFSEDYEEKLNIVCIEFLGSNYSDYEKNFRVWMDIQTSGEQAWKVLFIALFETQQGAIADYLDRKFAKEIFSEIFENETYPFDEEKNTDSVFDDMIRDHVLEKKPFEDIQIDSTFEVCEDVNSERAYYLKNGPGLIIDCVKDSYDGSMLDDVLTALGCQVTVCQSENEIIGKLSILCQIWKYSSAAVIVVHAKETEDGFSISPNDTTMSFREFYDKFSENHIVNIPKIFIFLLYPNVKVQKQYEDNQVCLFTKVLISGLMAYCYEKPIHPDIIEKVNATMMKLKNEYDNTPSSVKTKKKVDNIMEKEHRDKIRKNMVRLNRDLSTDGLFLDCFLAENIFSLEMLEIIQKKSTSYEKNSAFWMQLQKSGSRAWNALFRALIDSNQSDLAEMLDPVLARQAHKALRPGEPYPYGELRNHDTEFMNAVKKLVYEKTIPSSINIDQIDRSSKIHEDIDLDKAYHLKNGSGLIIDCVKDSHDGSMLDDVLTALGCQVTVCQSENEIIGKLSKLRQIWKYSSAAVIVVHAKETEDGFSIPPNDTTMSFREFYDKFSENHIVNIPKIFIFLLYPNVKERTVRGITKGVHTVSLSETQLARKKNLIEIPKNSMLIYHKVNFPKKWSSGDGSIFARILCAGLMSYFNVKPLKYIIEKVKNAVKEATKTFSDSVEEADGNVEEDICLTKTNLLKDFYVYGDKDNFA
ncbi:DgyrCDS173 [Dimorphilus gyrociliatus]|uniref:DgyrCDS173 n=1 Tax=Dimorphilus gyrociliatus TaxID=2664684 RepID=A0A7I8V530_9ANNE|nr:DgyrCDS173 [Dimorphilus gyrociliatus]